MVQYKPSQHAKGMQVQQANQYITTLEFLDGSEVDFGSFPAESFTDWLGAECHAADDPLFVAQMHSVTAEDFAGQSTAAILSVAMDEGQPARTRLAALGALRISFDAFSEEEEKRRKERRTYQVPGDLGKSLAECLALGVCK